MSSHIPYIIDNQAHKMADVKEIVIALRRPITRAQIKKVKEVLNGFRKAGDIATMVDSLKGVSGVSAGSVSEEAGAVEQIARDDLHLICLDHIAS